MVPKLDRYKLIKAYNSAIKSIQPGGKRDD
jgi:hypothetical protein